MVREVITLQLGNYSNYVATHFWNAQESYFTYDENDISPVDHNVHWRTGFAHGSETFLPRTVIYDLKGGFGAMRKINPMYEDTNQVSQHPVWSGRSSLQKDNPVIPSQYQESLNAGTEPDKLTATSVRYWSDFSRVYYHPRSPVQLYDYELNSTIMPFERFEMGSQLFQNMDKEHDIIDREWRQFAEECDCMQGIQVFTGLDDAWGGFASSYIEALRDEFSKTCIWVWGIQTPQTVPTVASRRSLLTNVAQSLVHLSPCASVTIPLSLPASGLPQQVELDTSSPWQTSALLSAACESLTLPTRLRPNAGESALALDNLVETINTNGSQSLAAAALTVACGNATPDIPEIEMGLSGTLTSPLKSSKSIFGRFVSSRGPNYAEQPNWNSQNRTRQPTQKSFYTPLEFPLLDSFPMIFRGGISREGISMQASVATTKAVRDSMKSLRAQAVRLVGSDEREILGHRLSEIGDAYQDDWSSGSDQDDDDL